MSDPYVELARRGYAAAVAGDLDAIAELLAEDVNWHGGDPDAPGTCHNRHQVLEFMHRARQSGRIGELVDVIDAGDRVVVIMRPISDSDEPLGLVANVTTFRAGKVVEMVHYPNPDDARAAVRA